MILLDPRADFPRHLDARTREVLRKTIEFFEAKGKARIKADYYALGWYQDFLDFVANEQIFATISTPAGEGADDSRWDTSRICRFGEILGFYGLQYWYTWQVTVLGLGPIWMSKNAALRKKAAAALQAGGIFAFGLSERAHGADIYSTEMRLVKQPDGTYLANGRKYYIGNGNAAAMVSVFGKVAGADGKDEYVFFAADPRHANYHLIQNVCASQNYVSEFELRDYPITDADILSRGSAAWDSALNTVNVGKYNLGWASIGICTHAFYEAITHATHRRLYGMSVTDFTHVKRLFIDAYARLTAMKLFAVRTSDYMRSASATDRRYLLYDPMAKMKVTTQGEDVINLCWDVIAAKGFEKDMYFSQAAVDIRGLPKLEGTVHVNIALIVKFMPAYFFMPVELPPVPRREDPTNDDFLFDQGSAKGLGQIRFHDYQLAYASRETPNLAVFREQVEAFKNMLATAPPMGEQLKDTDFLMAGGELFALVVYGQLILEAAPLHGIDDDHLDQMFDFLVRDFSRFALELSQKSGASEEQAKAAMGMVRRPVHDEARYQRMWTVVGGLADRYAMNP